MIIEDALERAIELVAAAETESNQKDSAHLIQATIAYAAIAQAEQLKRIADSLETIVNEWAKPRYVIRGE